MIRAYVHEAFISAPDTIGVSLVQEFDGPGFHERRILRLHADDEGRIVTRSWDVLDTDGMQPVAPTLTLGREEAHQMANALIGYFGGVDDQRMLRKDYQDERGRVDKPLDAVAEIARGRAA